MVVTATIAESAASRVREGKVMNLRNGLMAAAFAILAVVAVAGWARKPSSAGSAAALNSAGYVQTTYPQTASSSPQPTYLDQNGQPVSGSASVVTNGTQ